MKEGASKETIESSNGPHEEEQTTVVKAKISTRL